MTHKERQQGDVIIKFGPGFEAPPPGLKKAIPTERGYVLALGEATGHAHVIADPPTDLDVRYGDNGTFWIKSSQSVEVKHDTHHVQVTQPKVWNFIKRVEEVNPFTDEARIVQD